MSATSGIGISEELSSKFSEAVASRDVRFLKVSIRNESLVPDATLPPNKSLEEDLGHIQGLLEDNVPAYVLVRLDDPSASWLVVDYVPDSAKVRDKMLYASTRNSLTQNLGSSNFADTLFATSKDDLTPTAYAAHKRHLAAPQPLTAREKEIEDVKAAERQAGGTSRSLNSPFSAAVGYKWSAEVESAIQDLVKADEDSVVIITIDTVSETLTLVEASPISTDELGARIPASEPSYALFSWTRNPLRRQIVVVYSCPSLSPVRTRMLFSSGLGPLYESLKGVLPDGLLAARKLQTSDPKDLNTAYLQSELGGGAEHSGSGTPISSGEPKSFARPRPAKRQR